MEWVLLGVGIVGAVALIVAMTLDFRRVERERAARLAEYGRQVEAIYARLHQDLAQVRELRAQAERLAEWVQRAGAETPSGALSAEDDEDIEAEWRRRVDEWRRGIRPVRMTITGTWDDPDWPVLLHGKN